MPFALSKRLQGSLSLRLSFLFCLTFAVGLTFAFLISYFQIRYTLEKSGREVLSSKIQEVSALISSDGIHELKAFLSLEKNKGVNAAYRIRLINSSGQTVYVKPSVQEEKFDFEADFQKQKDPEKLLGWHSIPAFNDEDKFNILTEKVGSELYLQVGASSEDREDILDSIAVVFAIIGSIFIFFSGFLGAWYARKALVPLRTLSTTMRQIEKGNLSLRVGIDDSQDELRALGETFNRMVGRIEKLVQVMKESLDNVAHDIRTPLTRIRAVAEDAILAEEPELLKEALHDCAESAAEISGLVDQLMSISEAEAGTLSLKIETCDIQKILQEVAEIYEFVGHEKNINLEVGHFEKPLFWNLDRRKIKQAVANLLDNAIKFSPPSKKVFLGAVFSRGGLKIFVKDQGPGVTAHDLPRIWDRLFRGDKSRSSAGSGLGLAIVRSVATAHDGETLAEANTEGGMTFTILIPEKK